MVLGADGSLKVPSPIKAWRDAAESAATEANDALAASRGAARPWTTARAVSHLAYLQVLAASSIELDRPSDVRRWIEPRFPTLDESPILIEAWQELCLFRGEDARVVHECGDPDNDAWRDSSFDSFEPLIALARGAGTPFVAYVDRQASAADRLRSHEPSQGAFFDVRVQVQILGIGIAAVARLAGPRGVPIAPSGLPAFERWSTALPQDP